MSPRYFGKDNYFCTPLHIAAEYGNISAVELLLENGANIDECDSNHFSPLECILTRHFADKCAHDQHRNFDDERALDAAVRLVQLGAATGIVLSWPSMLLFDRLSSSPDLAELLFLQTPVVCPQQAPPVLDRATIVPHDWKPTFRDNSSRLEKFVPELEEADFGGKSFMHEAICWGGYAELSPRWNEALETMTPFPWHYHWPNFHQMAFLTSSFKLYRRGLSHDAFTRIMNLQPERGMSPLCRASSRGMLEITENCLTMGAEIDFEGCSLGSALMIACACGRLDAVKFLVRRGAAISYVGRNGLTSALVAGHRSKKILAWLLVGQFTEQGRLNCDDKPSSSSTASEIQPWSGIQKMALQLVGWREMQPHESSLQYAKFLLKLKRKLRGEVIPQ